MAAGREENWQIKRCGDCCSGSGRAFEDGEAIMTCLRFGDEGYVRADYGLDWWAENQPERGISAWKSAYHAPRPVEEPVKRENAESLLRALTLKEDPADINAIYILAVMLERKRILVEKDVQTREDQKKIRLYEHRKSGETFLVIDPELKLAEIEVVQNEVVGLLGGVPPRRK